MSTPVSASASFDSLMKIQVPTKTAMPSGTLMPNAQRQEKSVVSQPPNRGPSAAVPPIVDPQTAKAIALSLPRKPALIIDREVGSIMAPPMPCRSRAPMRVPPLSAMAASTEASMKITTPIRNSRRRPQRSANLPNINRKAANTSV